MLTAFIDTNVILHYRPICDIDWCKVCGEKPVTIMLCMPVIDELDRKKSDPRLGQRAKDRIRDLQQRAGNTLRENVTLQIYHDPEDDAGSGDKSIGRIVAAYRDRQGVNVVVITEDWGMMQRCEALGIRTVTPPAEQRLPDDESDDKKQIRKLQRELLELQNKQPRLDVTFSPEEVQQVSRPDLPAIAEQLRQLVQSIKGGHGYRAESQSVQNYLKTVEHWLKNDHAIADESARTIRLKVAVKNNGSAPAEGVDLTIKFPSVIKAISFDRWLDGDRARPFNRPNELTIFEKSLPEPTGPVPHTLGYQNHSLPLYGRVSQGVFTASIPLMAHGDERIFPDFYLTFRTWEDVRPFSAELTVRTLKPPSRDTLDIPVKAQIV